MKHIFAVFILFLAIHTYADDGGQLTARLQSIVIPEITIIDQPFNEAINIILAACAKTQTNQWTPGVILNLGKIPAHTVSIHAKDISLLELLQRFVSTIDLVVTVEENAVVIKQSENTNRVEQAVPGYAAQGAPKVNFNVRR